MSKKADDNWGRVWSKEAAMESGVALQHLATSIFVKWKDAFEREKYPGMVGLGQIHDLWNGMYEDMKAIYTLERLVDTEYGTRIIKKEFEEEHEGNRIPKTSRTVSIRHTI